MKSATVNAFNKIVSFNIANEQSPCGITRWMRFLKNKGIESQ